VDTLRPATKARTETDVVGIKRCSEADVLGTDFFRLGQDHTAQNVPKRASVLGVDQLP
jgi:hypothetical protein